MVAVPLADQAGEDRRARDVDPVDAAGPRAARLEPGSETLTLGGRAGDHLGQYAVELAEVGIEHEVLLVFAPGHAARVHVVAHEDPADHVLRGDEGHAPEPRERAAAERAD